MLSKIQAALFTLIATLALYGCGDRPLENISNYQLQEKLWQCSENKSPSPSYAQQCRNYERECKARRKEGSISHC